MAEFIDYEIWLGTFEGEDFVWKVIKKFNSFDEAYDFYHDYVMKQSKYTDDELKKIWSSGRIDVELRQGKKLLNWAGLFSRRVADPEFVPEEPKASEGETPKKGEAPKKDSADFEEYEVVSPSAHFIWGCDSLEEAKEQLVYVKEELGYADAYLNIVDKRTGESRRSPEPF